MVVFSEKKSPSGFTLVEILIATAILAVIVSIVFTSYTGGMKIISETQSQSNIYSMARIASERIKEDLESSYIGNSFSGETSDNSQLERPFFRGEDGEIKDKRADSITFFSRSHIKFEEESIEPDACEIKYYTLQKNEEDFLSLFRSDTHIFKGVPEKADGGFLLCDNLISLNFTYYDEQGVEYDAWDSEGDELKDRLPCMISIEMKFHNSAAPGSALKFFTSVRIPMAKAENEFI